MKLQRKDLTSNQFMRSNKLTALSITLVYVIFIFLNFTDKLLSLQEKFIFFGIYLVYYAITAIFIRKYIKERKGMLILAITFELSYTLLIMTTSISSIFLIFPVLLTITVYLNEVIFLWGSLASAVLIIIKAVVIHNTGVATETDLIAVNIAILGVIISLFGGFKAIRLLVQFSNEETTEVKTLLEKQKEVSNQVEEVVSIVSSDFKDVMSDLHSINETVDSTSYAMNEIAKGSEQTAFSASEQANMTNEIHERLQSTNKIAGNAKDTSDELKRAIKDGKIQSDELEKQSIIVDEYTTQISDTIKELADHVEKVANITDTILNISSQTNLLALNASIEAARAGEAGKGFAVVADEIRNLAEETKNSTEMITGIMNELTAVTEKTQAAVTKSVEGISIQREKIGLVNKSFLIVDDGVANLASNVDQMTEEVVAVLEANHKIVSNVDTLAAISEEISSNALQSANDTTHLADSMNKFTSIIDNTSEKIQKLKEIAES